MKFEEKRDLILAWLVLGLAFANLLGGLGIDSIFSATVTAGLGFLLHELAHKVVAQKFGLNAEFIADYKMLALAFFGSFAGFIFAAPGAVYTRGQRNLHEQLWITAAGPLTNIFLALIFLLVPGQIGSYGHSINSWLALFNMIPFGPIDGKKILDASRPVYIGIVIASVLVWLL
jgi:Zn-dependent protease